MEREKITIEVSKDVCEITVPYECTKRIYLYVNGGRTGLTGKYDLTEMFGLNRTEYKKYEE